MLKMKNLSPYENAIGACPPCSIVHKKERYDFLTNNLMFKKSARANSENHLMQVRYAFVAPK